MKGELTKSAVQRRDAFEPPFAVLASDTNRYVLDNGMAILTREIYPSKVVFLSLWARVGSSYETEEEAGISHFVEHMLFKNTKKRSVGQIAQEIHSLGGYLNGFTSYDCTAYWMVIPATAFQKALEIQYDAIFNPLFDSKEVEKEAGVIIEEIKMYKDRPSDYLSSKLMKKAMQEHRYGRQIIGYEKVIKKLRANDLQKYYNTYYKPNNCFVLAVGDIDSMDIVRKCERTYKKLREGKVERNPSPREPEQRELRRFEMEGNILTAHMQFAFHIPSTFDRDIYALSILSTVIGSGESSRLYAELREKHKIVSDIGSYCYAQRDPCLLFVDAELPPEHISEAEAAVFEIIKDIRENGLSDREFERAKNLSESNYIYAQETVEAQGRRIGYAEIMGDYMLPEKFIQRLITVTKEDVQQAAQKYLTPQNCTVGIYKPSVK